MSYNNLLFEIKENILTILINRPKQLNSINLETLFELDSLIKDSILNDEIRLIVLSRVEISHLLQVLILKSLQL